jgi:(2Fe-2S) ferredoxin
MGATISKKAKKGKAGTNGQVKTPPGAKVRGYESHVLICKGGDCKKRGSKDIRKVFKNELRTAGLNRGVRVDGVDCLGLCKHGPNAIVYPPGAWYLGLDADSVPEIVEQHLASGQPVEELAAEFRPPKKK